jgi:AraC-like DNA-binding protein/mannose-6-phosphate isomerase-like protein (cupin superfamily)
MNKVARMSHNQGQDSITCRFCGNADFPYHAHDFYDFQIVLSGSGEHIVNNSTYELKRGHTFLMRLTDCHQKIASDDFTFIVIQVHPGDMPKETLKRLDRITGDPVTYLDEESTEQMICLSELLKKACGGEYPNSESMKKNLIEVIFSIFLKNLNSDTISPKTNERISEIMIYINENFASRLTVGDVAEKFYMNVSYFCECFKKYTGRTFTEYLASVRLDRAARLVSHTDKSVAEIAAESGFGSISQFLRRFKEKFACTPSEYRKKH